MAQPTTGVFIARDEEDVTMQRREAGTVRDRTVVMDRRTVTRRALWANKVSDENIAAAERYVANAAEQYENVRVQVFTGATAGSRR